MNIHPEFFDSVDEFVARRLEAWELENPRPEYDLPTRPEKPEPHLIPLQGQGFIVVEPTPAGGHFQITVRRSGKTLDLPLEIDMMNNLIEALMFVLAESEPLHDWNSKYKPLQRQYNQERTEWHKKRDELVQKSIQAYESLKSAENGNERVYSVRPSKSYSNKDCFAVCINGAEADGLDAWRFFTKEEAYQDAERRCADDIKAGKVASVNYEMRDEYNHAD